LDGNGDLVPNIPELETVRFSDLLDQADRVFVESTGPIDKLCEIQDTFNAVLAGGQPSPVLDLVGPHVRPILDLLERRLKGTSKQVVLEKTDSPPIDYLSENRDVLKSFARYPLDQSMGRLSAYLDKIVPYLYARDDDVSRQVISTEGTVLVLFGRCHANLVEVTMANTSRPVEVSYSKDPRVGFESRIYRDYKRYGIVNCQAALRWIMEDLALDVLADNSLGSMNRFSGCAYEFASGLRLREVHDFVKSCDIDFCHTYRGRLFEDFLENNRLPSLEKIKGLADPTVAIHDFFAERKSRYRPFHPNRS